jgi:hypothetical protein
MSKGSSSAPRSPALAVGHQLARLDLQRQVPPAVGALRGPGRGGLGVDQRDALEQVGDQRVVLRAGLLAQQAQEVA